MRIPPDLDVGDLALTAGSVARLVVLDPARVPVAGARVHAPGLHVAAAETDAEGRATLIGLPPNAQLEVLARGFDPVQFPTPPSDDLFEVVLARATRLKITVLGPLDAPAREPAAA